MKKGRFIVLFVRGGGSTFLAESLNQVSNVLCLREPKIGAEFFCKNSQLLSDLQDKDDKKHRKGSTQRWLECSWVGAKLKFYNQVSSDLKKELLKGDIPVVICLRDNIVSHTIGLCRKDLCDKSVVWSESEKASKSLIDIDHFKRNLKFVIEENKRLVNFSFKLKPKTYHYVFYENMCQNLDREVNRIMQFLTKEEWENCHVDRGLLPLKVTNAVWHYDVNNYIEIIKAIDDCNLKYSDLYSSFLVEKGREL